MRKGEALTCRPTSGPNRGFSIAELIVSSGLLVILVVLIGALHLTSHKAHSKTSVSQEMTGDGSLITRLLGSELQRSAYTSVSVEPDGKAICFLASTRADGTVLFNSAGHQIWDHWVIFYWQGEELRRREFPWVDGPTVRENPATIEAATGIPLAAYLTGEGKTLSRQVELFQIEVSTSDQLVSYRLSLQSRTDSAHSLKLKGKVRPRN